MAEPLEYAAAPVYRRRRSARAQGVAVLAFAGLAAVGIPIAFDAFISDGGWLRWIVYLAFAVLFGVPAVFAVKLVARGGCWETRIEGGRLYLVRPGEPPHVIDVEEIAQFVRLDVTVEDGLDRGTVRSHELRLRDGRRVPLDEHAVGWMPAFRRALLRQNPRIELAYEHQDHVRKPR